MGEQRRRDSPPGLSSSARSLIDAAERHELGVAFLSEGFPESVAAIHNVHVDVVHEARSHLGAAPTNGKHAPEESPPFRSTKPPGPREF